MGKIYLNDVGTRFEVTVKDEGEVVDISGATQKQIIFKKPGPDNSIIIKEGTFTTDGKDGKMEYLTVDGDLNHIGVWFIQTKITLGAGTWSSEMGVFKVWKTLQ